MSMKEAALMTLSLACLWIARDNGSLVFAFLSGWILAKSDVV